MTYRLNQVKEDAIYDFVKDSVGSDVNVIWDKPGELRPNKPYITMSILSGPTKIGTNAEKKYKTLDTYTYYFQKKFTLSISVYTNSNDFYIMNNIQNALFLETKLDILRNGGLSVWNINGPFDISETIDNDWEYRNHLDIVMSYGEEIDDITGEIHSIELNDRTVDIN